MSDDPKPTITVHIDAAITHVETILNHLRWLKTEVTTFQTCRADGQDMEPGSPAHEANAADQLVCGKAVAQRIDNIGTCLNSFHDCCEPLEEMLAELAPRPKLILDDTSTVADHDAEQPSEVPTSEAPAAHFDNTAEGSIPT